MTVKSTTDKVYKHVEVESINYKFASLVGSIDNVIAILKEDAENSLSVDTIKLYSFKITAIFEVEETPS